MNNLKENGRALWPIWLSIALTAVVLFCLLHTGGSPSAAADTGNKSAVAQFESQLENLLSTEYGGKATQVKRGYLLHDSDIVAPKPNPGCFGQVDDPREMEPIIEQARQLLNIGDMAFSTDVTILKGSVIQYYLDETIFAMTWKTPIDGTAYTFSEVKVAHASQFRRFLSEGKYNSGVLHTTTEMATSVNAVVASSGDFYEYRRFGIVVNQGHVYRDNGKLLDTCFVDDEGDLHFAFAREMTEKDQIEQFVQDNNIRFSISFGPVLIVDGQSVLPKRYNSGEITGLYPRAALCQMDKRHYVTVVANAEAPHYRLIPLEKLVAVLMDMGVPTAYALDGGQTGAIVFNNRLVNHVSYGSERHISDIIYFATAIPDNG